MVLPFLGMPIGVGSDDDAKRQRLNDPAQVLADDPAQVLADHRAQVLADNILNLLREAYWCFSYDQGGGDTTEEESDTEEEVLYRYEYQNHDISTKKLVKSLQLQPELPKLSEKAKLILDDENNKPKSGDFNSLYKTRKSNVYQTIRELQCLLRDDVCEESDEGADQKDKPGASENPINWMFREPQEGSKLMEILGRIIFINFPRERTSHQQDLSWLGDSDSDDDP